MHSKSSGPYIPVSGLGTKGVIRESDLERAIASWLLDFISLLIGFKMILALVSSSPIMLLVFVSLIII